ncbi:MAG: hypothetical protein KJ574_01715, partial [Nanoarchaeota archaeon]|nr:hypothetical protein [Nanoarchaeota archaeon]
RVEVSLEEGSAVYDITTARRARLLGFIPVNIEIRRSVEAENLTLLRERKPWWSFLATSAE